MPELGLGNLHCENMTFGLVIGECPPLFTMAEIYDDDTERADGSAVRPRRAADEAAHDTAREHRDRAPKAIRIYQSLLNHILD